jgi:hypothetical protein
MPVADSGGEAVRLSQERSAIGSALGLVSMSVYGYLACEQCRIYMWLGKALRREDDSVLKFHVGDEHEPPNSEKTIRTKALWKMLADHTGHPLRVLLEHELDALLDTKDDAREIGGEIPFDEYLSGWKG